MILTADLTGGVGTNTNTITITIFQIFKKKMHEIKKIWSVGRAPLNPPTVNSTKVGPQNPEPAPSPPPPKAINGYVNLEHNNEF